MGNTFSWNGGNGDFSVAANWFDTDGPTPGPPTATDKAGLFSNGGTITGSGTVGLLQTSGSGPWTLAGDFVLAGETEPSGFPFAFWVTNNTTIATGATIDASGGQLLVDTPQSTTLSVQPGATVLAMVSTIGSLPGNQGTLDIDGAQWSDVVATSVPGSGSMTIGVGALGYLDVTNASTLNTGANVGLGNVASAAGNATISGGSRWSIGTFIVIGYGGEGSFSVLSGSQVATHGGFDQMGGTATGSGTLTVDGAGSSFSSGAQGFTDGGSGAAAVIVSNAATFATVGGLSVGAGDGGSGSITVNAATLSVGGNFVLGGPGSGSVVITGQSTVSDAGALTVGASGEGSLSVAGGAMSVAGSFVQLGAFAGGSGSLSVSNGATFTAASLLNVGAGGSGAIVLNGGTLNAQAGLFIGGAGDGTGTIMGGGMMSVSDGLSVGLNGQGSLGLSGGLLSTTGSVDQLGAFAGASGTMSVTGPGAIYHSGAGVFDIGASGGATLLIAAGTVTTGATSMANVAGATGAASVSDGGTWSLSAALAIGYAGDAAVAITSGGQVSTGPGFDQMGGVAGGSGTLSISGAGSAFRSGASAFTVGIAGTGAVSVADGGLLSTAGLLSFAGDSGAVATGLVSGGTMDAGGGLLLGSGGLGSLLVSAGGTVSVTGASIISAAAGGQGSVAEVGGSGALWQMTGGLLVGYAAAGSLLIAAGGTVTAAHLYAGQAGASGVISVQGTGSLLSIAGAGTLGDGGAAALVLGNGGSVDVAGTLVIGSDGTVVAQGGSLDPALIVNDGVIGGVGTVIGDIDNAGTITATKGQLVLTGSVDGTGGTLAVGAGGTLLAAGTVAAGQTISFADATGTLALGITGNIAAAPIAGFTAGDQIVIHGQVTATASYDPAANTLSLFGDGGTPVGTLQFTGTHTASDFSDAVTAQVACYAAGTRIATPRGYVPVEQLQIGDHALLAFGGAAPITWLGHRRVACRRHPRPHEVQPICVHRGAFGFDRPCRDLHLSPDHTVAIDGVLIPIRYLVNGATIVRQEVAAVDYWHVELPAHGVILAEGLPAESYLDTGNRAAFVDGGDALQLHPDFARPDFARSVWSERACAELVLAGPRLHAARRSLLARAEALGHRSTTCADLTVLADGHVLPTIVEGNVLHVRIPTRATRIRLVSRRWVPGETLADADDARVLGVALSGLRLDGQPIALNDARLTSGWHAPEAGFRWTDGDAGLALAGVRTLSVAVALTGTYWARRARYSRRTMSMSSCTEVLAAARS